MYVFNIPPPLHPPPKRCKSQATFSRPSSAFSPLVYGPLVHRAQNISAVTCIPAPRRLRSILYK